MDESYDVLANAERVIAAEERWRRWQEGDRIMGNRLFKAMMIAQTVEDCEALLRGEDVPIERLDREWCRRFGIHG